MGSAASRRASCHIRRKKKDLESHRGRPHSFLVVFVYSFDRTPDHWPCGKRRQKKGFTLDTWCEYLEAELGQKAYFRGESFNMTNEDEQVAGRARLMVWKV